MKDWLMIHDLCSRAFLHTDFIPNAPNNLQSVELSA